MRLENEIKKIIKEADEYERISLFIYLISDSDFEYLSERFEKHKNLFLFKDVKMERDVIKLYGDILSKEVCDILEESYDYFNYWKDRFSYCGLNDFDMYNIYMDALINCAKSYVNRKEEWKETHDFKWLFVGYFRGYINNFKVGSDFKTNGNTFDIIYDLDEE